MGWARSLLHQRHRHFLDVPTEEAIAMAYPEAEIRTPLPGYTSAISPAKAKRILVGNSNTLGETFRMKQTATLEPRQARKA